MTEVCFTSDVTDADAHDYMLNNERAPYVEPKTTQSPDYEKYASIQISDQLKCIYDDVESGDLSFEHFVRITRSYFNGLNGLG